MTKKIEEYNYIVLIEKEIDPKYLSRSSDTRNRFDRKYNLFDSRVDALNAIEKYALGHQPNTIKVILIETTATKRLKIEPKVVEDK